MTKFFPFLFLCLILTLAVVAQQQQDSVVQRHDSAGQVTVHPAITTTPENKKLTEADSISFNPTPGDGSQPASMLFSGKPFSGSPLSQNGMAYLLAEDTWFGFSGTPQPDPMPEHKPASDDGLFYILIALFSYFALIRVFFAKYMNNLLSLFLRASMRQQQIREQLSQTPLPSLLLNLLFVLTGGLYVCFLLRYYLVLPDLNFWLLALNCAMLVGLMYACKFFVLKMAGWVFNIPKATDTYIFIVYMVNKIMGILLLPVLVLLFYSTSPLRDVMVIISLCLVGFLIMYRFIAAFPSLRNEIKISIFYFFVTFAPLK